MTPEREEHINWNILQEERYIRIELKELKKRLKFHKKLLTEKYNKKARSSNARKYKIPTHFLVARDQTIIKALKKCIPQKLVFHNEPNHECWICPACHYKILNIDGKTDGIKQCCSRCGQKYYKR